MALQNSTTEGYLPLCEMIAHHSARHGIKIAIESDSGQITNLSSCDPDLERVWC
jgi:histidinol phosphatase-like PHP family hydrolase